MVAGGILEFSVVTLKREFLSFHFFLTHLNYMPWREKVETKEYSYTVLFEPAEEGGYVVTCPALPGLATEGDTLEEARAMARDAIHAYLESLRKDALPIPFDKEIKLQPGFGRLSQ